ncbi:hypothetical protein C1Y40_05093 [Mycobacterium talmoniae]|uniref:NAD-specific glutamate dehydrogenase n=1 Tax=Mycobacterium talmoniae TaxID=1858794 RepID=A0A2S8BDK7_9MYCO|nr:hypothetical protein C1Y40_05093 [Mycobacterium talmoniae]
MRDPRVVGHVVAHGLGDVRDIGHHRNERAAHLDGRRAERRLGVGHLGVEGFLGLVEALDGAVGVGGRVLDGRDLVVGGSRVLADELQHGAQRVLAAGHQRQRLLVGLDGALAGLERVREAGDLVVDVGPLLDQVGVLDAQATARLAELLERQRAVLDGLGDALRSGRQAVEHLIGRVGGLLAFEHGVDDDLLRRIHVLTNRVRQHLHRAGIAALAQVLLHIAGVEAHRGHLVAHLLGGLHQLRNRVRHVLRALLGRRARLGDLGQRPVDVLQLEMRRGRDRLDCVQGAGELLEVRLGFPHRGDHLRHDIGGRPGALGGRVEVTQRRGEPRQHFAEVGVLRLRALRGRLEHLHTVGAAQSRLLDGVHRIGQVLCAVAHRAGQFQDAIRDGLEVLRRFAGRCDQTLLGRLEVPGLLGGLQQRDTEPGR